MSRGEGGAAPAGSAGAAPTDDAWLFGWDPTPGIVSVWADHGGRALVWQRQGARVVRHEERFRPWLVAASLDDVRHLAPALLGSEAAGADSAPFSYRELDGPPGTLRYLLSARDGRALRRAVLHGASRRLGAPVRHLSDLGGDYYAVGAVEQYLMQTGRVSFRGLAYDDLLCGAGTSSGAILAKISRLRSSTPTAWSATAPSPPAMIARAAAGMAAGW